MTCNSSENRSFRPHTGLFPVLLSVLVLALAGCDTMNSLPPSAAGFGADQTNALILHAGDTIKVSFPGAPNLDTTTAIRLDGKITIPTIGDVFAVGLTPDQLQQQILHLAGPQLVVKDVNVSVLSSAFQIYLEGAVMRPGRLVSDRVLTPLEALSEGGIDFQKANLKAVHIIRCQPNGQTANFKIDIKATLDGRTSERFELRPFDIVYVPERFNWF